MSRRFTPSLAVAVTLGLLVAPAVPAAAQARGTQPTVRQLLEKIRELERKLADQQRQNAALERKLHELEATVSDLAGARRATERRVAALPAAAPPVRPKGTETVTIKGFISASYIAQDTRWAFSNGQNGQFPLPPEYTGNEWSSGGDVRNTRINLGFAGPDLGGGWHAGATLEADFFGGFNGSGAFSHQQLTPRIRLGYIDLTRGRTTLRFGQAWSPLFGEVPRSLTHVAFPLGWGSAGSFGWRFPGLYLYRDLTPEGGRTRTRFQLGIFEGSWAGPGNNVNMETAGNVGFRPQVEARLDLAGKTAGGDAWKLYIVGHWDEKDLRGVNNVNPAPRDDSLTGTALEVGGRLDAGRLTIHGNAYVARALGQQLAAITQFGDIQDWGAWLQLGYHLSDRWSVWGFYGVCDPDDRDVLEWIGENGRMKNQQYHMMLLYGAGQYAFSLEWLHDTLEVGPEATDVTGNQIALSAMYTF